ncbi:MAG TPA: hypothetical protein VFJ43_09330 [Bacteroidia bacterium]|nr:hypothetical protein [Bacteroidia bacterium]
MKSDYSWYLLLANISACFVVIPLCIGFARRSYFKIGEKVLLLLMVISTLVEITSFFIRDRHANNLYVYDIYTVFEFVLLSVFFINVIEERRLIFSIKILIAFFFGIAALNFFLNGYTSMDNFSTATESILFILYSTAFFYLLLRNPVSVNVLATPLFWLNTAILIYFSGSLFLFIFSNYLELHSPKIYFELWGIHSILNILFYSLISIGFWKTKQQ